MTEDNETDEAALQAALARAQASLQGVLETGDKILTLLAETQDPDDENRTYKIVRFYHDDRANEIVTRGLTLAQAAEQCRGNDSHGEGWFDGYLED